MSARVAYLVPRERFGSAYKHVELLHRELGGEIWPLWDHKEETARVQLLGRGLPALAVVRGDHVAHYRACLELGVPYLLLENDIATIRQPDAGLDELERERLEGARGVIFTSEDCAAYCAAKYRLPPHETIHLRPLRSMLGFAPRPKLPGRRLVYAGGLVGWEQRTGALGYRAYYGIFRELVRMGWAIDVYTAVPGAVREQYRGIGVNVIGRVSQHALYETLSAYTAGFLGYNRAGVPEAAFAYTQLCRPNKTWEYLAAGIPTIAYQAGNTASLIGEWGLVLEELAHLDGYLPAIRAEVRRREVMDEDAPALRELLADAGVYEL